MNRQNIICLPHKSLRKKSSNVRASDKDIKKLVKDMEQAGFDWQKHHPHEHFVGLAGVQVNILKKIVIVRQDIHDKSNNNFVTYLNPKLIKGYGKIEYDYEGCLSVPNKIYGLVPRWSKIKFKATDLEGNEVRIKLDGFAARLMQHEIDHTNGVVFVDHIKDDDEAWYKINDKGKMEQMDYDKIQKSDLLWK